MHLLILNAALLLSPQATPTPAETPTAEAIMARVATNQDTSDAERTRYLYIQHAVVTSRKGKTIMCEEITDSRIIPIDHGARQQLLKLAGRMLVKKEYVLYTELPTSKDAGTKNSSNDDSGHDEPGIHISTGDNETDRSLVESIRSNLTRDKSKDGISAGLFPLTSKSQAGYQFHLVGREHINGRDVFHIDFHPKEKDEFTWKGDAYIDATAYQPVVVRTTMARKIPFAVRTLLGTSLPGLGFTVTYAPQPDGVWFPETFGTEFKLKILFFFSREILISARNRDFEKTHVTSHILTEEKN